MRETDDREIVSLKDVLANLEFTERGANRWESPARGPMRVPACVYFRSAGHS